MGQRTQIVAELKRALRARGLTYAQVAKHLQLSEASVKRLFAAGDLSLERLKGRHQIHERTAQDGGCPTVVNLTRADR